MFSPKNDSLFWILMGAMGILIGYHINDAIYTIIHPYLTEYHDDTSRRIFFIFGNWLVMVSADILSEEDKTKLFFFAKPMFRLVVGIPFIIYVVYLIIKVGFFFDLIAFLLIVIIFMFNAVKEIKEEKE